MAKKVKYTQPLLGEVNAAGYLILVPGAVVQILQDGAPVTVYSDEDGTEIDTPNLPSGVASGSAGLSTRGELTVWLEPGTGYSGVSTVGQQATTFPIGDIAPHPDDVQAPIPPGTYVPSAGTTTRNGSLRLQSDVEGEHPLEVYSDNGHASGNLERFSVEVNTPADANVDINFRACDVNFGAPSLPELAFIKFYSPAAASYDPIRVYQPGSLTNLSLSMSQAGTISSYAKGQASGAAFGLSAWGDAERTFAIGAPDGKLSWGPGGATAADTHVYRDSAGYLRISDNLKLGASAILRAVSGDFRLCDSDGSLAFTIRMTDLLTHKILILGPAGTALQFAEGGNILLGSATGTKLGTSATEKLGLWGATPVVRPTGVPVTPEGIHAALVTIGAIAA